MKTEKQHWSVDETELKKDRDAHAVWRLEQRINYGLGEQKINRAELKKYWRQIDIDPFKRVALSSVLS